MRLHKDLSALVATLQSSGGRVEQRGKALHAFAPDGAWLMAFSSEPRNPQGTRQQLTTKLRRLGLVK